MEVQRALHALQQGSDMAAVFARYERDLERLRNNNEQLRAQNDSLAKAQAGCESPGYAQSQNAQDGNLGCNGRSKTRGVELERGDQFF